MVWTEPGGAIPPDLARVLDKRGLPPVHAGSPHAALAELCLAERAGVRVALIVCDVPDPARLLAAAERFAPAAVVWNFQPGANPPLRPFVLPADRPRPERASPQNGVPAEPGPTPAKAAESPARPAESPPDRAPGREGAPAIRLVRENGLKPDSPQADAIRKERPVSARDILDDAELEMLLAGERAMEDDAR